MTEATPMICGCGNDTFVPGPQRVDGGQMMRCSRCGADAVRLVVRWSGPNPPQRHARDWTEAQVDALAQAYRDGVATKDLPAIAGHPPGSCATKIAELIRQGVLKARMVRHPRTEPPVQRVAA